MAVCNDCGRQIEDDEAETAPGMCPRRRASTCDGCHRAGGCRASDTDREDRCPTCGTVLGPAPPTSEEEVPVKAPWHFKVLVVGTVVYLGYRLYQGIGWLIHHT